MYIESLALDNFRNFEKLSLEMSPHINILYGDNAQGKTNILEALYLCATTRSHRGSKDKEMIRFNADEAHLRMMLMKNNVRHKIDMHLKHNKSKGIAIDGIPIRKSAELFGLIHVICFSPEDLSMIKNGPGERRRFMNMELCQLDSVYYHQLAAYSRIIIQRNNLLRQIGFKPSLTDTLEVWDMQLADYGRKIIAARRQFIAQLNELLIPIHRKLTGGKEDICIRYEPNVSEAEFEKKLLAHRENDIRTRMTGTGPHRDDFSFYLQDKDIDLRRFGSQGQQRTAALSLKLAEIELVHSVIHDQPVLLLDDVLSELDSQRQNYLLDSIRDTQTVITGTGFDEFVNSRFNINCIFNVTNGTVTLMSHDHGLGGIL